MSARTWLARAARRFRVPEPTARSNFQHRVERTLAAGQALTLVYLNIKGFRCVARMCGPQRADRILGTLGQRFAGAFGEAAVVRLPGDEFLLQFQGNADDADVRFAMCELGRLIAQPFAWPGHELTLSAAIGSASGPREGNRFQQLFEAAEQAMLDSRPRGGRASSQDSDALQEAASSADECIRQALQMALERREFVLHYQPQIELATGAVIGAEALVRWMHPEHGLMVPGQFIEDAERTGMIVPIGRWVLQEACRQAVRWRAAGYGMRMMAVNLSACQFEAGALADVVQEAMNDAGLPPACLELELTENILIRDTDKVLKQIRQLKDMGLTLSLDDFGTGYSSLSYLKKFAVDRIKIDRSFVSGLGKDPSDATIVRAIVEIARSLGLRTIAEGVEDARTLEYLQLLNCDEAQGYFFAPPMPPSAFEQMLSMPPVYCSRTNDPLKSGHQPLDPAAPHFNGNGRCDLHERLME